MCEVVRQVGKSSVYEVRYPKTGKQKMLHRNMLLQCNNLPLETKLAKRIKKSIPYSKKLPDSVTESEKNESDSGSDSDSSEGDENTGETNPGKHRGLPRRTRVPPDRYGSPVIYFHQIVSEVFIGQG